MQTINTKTGSSADSKFHIMELLDYHVLDNFSRLGFLIRRIAAVGFFVTSYSIPHLLRF